MHIAKLNLDGISYQVRVLRSNNPADIPSGFIQISRAMAQKAVYDNAGNPSNIVPESIKNFDPLAGIKGAKDFAEFKTEFVKLHEG